MIFKEEFYLNFPVEEAWAFFSDFPGPIKVLPGAHEVKETGPLQYLGAILVHIGPFEFTFRGQMHITKVNHQTREVVIKGGACDLTLGGHFEATAFTRTIAAGPNRSCTKLEVHVGLGGLLGKLGIWLIRPKARSIVEHYAELVSQELRSRKLKVESRKSLSEAEKSAFSKSYQPLTAS